MDDLISRQAAIEAICKVCSIVGDYHKCDGYPETSTWCEEITALRTILSADVQPVRHGEWLEENSRPKSAVFYCSICHGTAYDIQPTRDKMWKKRCRYAYCPNCGARMDFEKGDKEK